MFTVNFRSRKVAWTDIQCIVRRSISNEQKKSYINAVQCLQTKPTLLNASVQATWPGVKSHYDDFVGTHISMTPFIHMTVGAIPVN